MLDSFLPIDRISQLTSLAHHQGTLCLRPPKMTTICPLGPSAVSPITSLMGSFRDEVESLLPKKVLINNE